ncbi:MAG: septum formation initiator family protein [Acidimicrobiales bacterium]|nr:septum formation initiator family protein [Acidimicrobiales bacterium]
MSIVTKFRLGRLGRRSLVVVVAAAVIALAANTFLPYRQYLDQGRSIEQAKQELFELEQRRSDLETRLERAQDKTIIKREARKQMSLVEPGDELFRVVVPADVINLPRGWYLPGIEYLITGKSE